MTTPFKDFRSVALAIWCARRVRMKEALDNSPDVDREMFSLADDFAVTVTLRDGTELLATSSAWALPVVTKRVCVQLYRGAVPIAIVPPRSIVKIE